MKKIVLTALSGVAVLALNSGVAMADSHSGCDVNTEGMEPSATITGSLTNVALLVGARWGSGVLTLSGGETKDFDILGFKALETGVATTEFEGEVYNLENVDDFIGTYYGAAAGVTLGSGEGETIVNNAACVIIKAKSSKEGVAVSAPGPGGLEISWD